MKLLENCLKEIGISCSKEQTDAFMTYLSELKKWNRTYNLTALKKDEDIIVKHFIDSLLYLKVLPSGSIKLADAGTGAGFPGIPLKILRPEISLTLIESSRKKAAFLRHAIRTLKLNDASVLEQRLEHIGDEYKKSFDVIVTRATFSIKDFIKMACPYIKDEGCLVLNKGPKALDELNELNDSPYKNSLRENISLHLPVIKAQRNLIVLSCKL